MANERTQKHYWSSLPVYRPRTGLTAEQLNASQSDVQTRARIVNLGMHGVGIAHGYEIRVDDEGRTVVQDGAIHVGCGLGFDRYGRMLYWKGGWICLDDILGCRPEKPGCYCLSVHYAERSGHGRAFDPCHEGTDWVSTCVGFTLEYDCCPDQPCLPAIDPCDCIERWEYVCERNGFVPGETIPKDADLNEACEDPPPLALDHCGKVGYDPEAGLPLACVELCEAEDRDCNPPVAFCRDCAVKTCRKRKVAYRNQLLYELLSRRDVPLARVSSHSWAARDVDTWSDEDRMPFEEFEARVKECHKGPGFDPDKAFTICFDRPLLRATLHPMSVIMDLYIQQERPFYWMPHRTPLNLLHLDRERQVITDDAEPCAWGVVLCPVPLWIQHEIDDPASSILDCSNRGYLARVEILLNCNLIRDKCGRMPDARPHWVDEKDPCGDRAGQAMPGATWRTAVRIDRRRRGQQPYGHEPYGHEPPREEPYHAGPGGEAPHGDPPAAPYPDDEIRG